MHSQRKTRKPRGRQIPGGEDFFRVLAESLGGRVADLLGAGLDFSRGLGEYQHSTAPRPAIRPVPAHYAALGLHPAAPDWLCLAVWRLWVQREHPDKGGSADRLIQLTQAWELVKRERGL